MAILDIDSFDGYATADMANAGWTQNVTVSIVAAAGRNGTQALRCNDWDEYTVRLLPSAQATTCVGFAFWVNILYSSAQPILRWYDNATLHMQLMLAANGSLYFANSAGTQLGSATGVGTVVASTYIHLGAKVTISDTVGTIDLYVNGIFTASISATSLDTRNGGNASADRLVLGGTVNASGTPTYDDWYVTDGTYLGDCGVYSCLPTGNGNSSQLVGSDADSTNNYLLVDEATPNADTDYVESSTVGNKDTYAMADVTPTTGTVHAVKVIPWVRKTDAGARSFVSVVRLSTTEEDSSAKVLSTSYQPLPDIRTTKPGGGAFSITDVNNSEVGVKVDA